MNFLEHRSRPAKPLSEYDSLKLALETSSLRIGEAVKSEALGAFVCMSRDVEAWLRMKGRRLPDPRTIDAQRYPRPSRQERRRHD